VTQSTKKVMTKHYTQQYLTFNSKKKNVLIHNDTWSLT